jgi:predicted methyltransferase
MPRALRLTPWIVALSSACASALPPETAPPAPVVAAPLAPVEAAPQPVAREPTPEEQKRGEELQKLQQDYVKLQADHAAELARFTPELRAEAQALADKRYPTARAAIQAALQGKHRKRGHAERDIYRHPLQTLEFFVLKPTLTVFEYGPGEGWYTELLAPALAKQGKLVVNASDPNGPPEERSTLYGRRVKLLLERLPELYNNVQVVSTETKAPALGLEGTVDLALVIRGIHGMHNNGVLRPWLDELYRALKPKGVLGIVQHRAPKDANPDESSKQGYVPEAWLIDQVTAAGFRLVAKSEINANPKDTKDHPEGVWTLPPTLRLGDRDREKYLAIGESDRMTLKFTKVDKVPAR